MRRQLLDRLAAAGAAGDRAEVVASAALSVIRPVTDSSTADAQRQEREVLFAAWLEALDALAAGRPRCGWSKTSTGPAATCWPSWTSPPRLGPRRLSDPGGCWWPRLGRRCSKRVPSGPRRMPSTGGTASSSRRSRQLRPATSSARWSAMRCRTHWLSRSRSAPTATACSSRSYCARGSAWAPWSRRDRRWHLTVAAEEVSLPASVQSIYAAQLDDLPADARLIARRASVAGRRFPVRALEPLGTQPMPAWIRCDGANCDRPAPEASWAMPLRIATPCCATRVTRACARGTGAPARSAGALARECGR